MWTNSLYDTTKLTLELRDIVDNGDNSVDIWDFEYPSYYTGDEKKAFERKFIDHYYFRQLGQETVGRWLHYFRARIREIMPYYIQMYKSVEIMDNIPDPFGNVDITETFEQETSGEKSGTQSGESSGTQSGTNTDTATTETSGETNNSLSGSSDTTRTNSESKEHRFSNTPQGSIENLENYMSEASRDNNTNNESTDESHTETGKTTTSDSGQTTSNGTHSLTTSGKSDLTTGEQSTGKVTHTLTRKGNQGVNTYAHDMIEYRQSFINVDMMIIESCNDLFLGIF